MAGEVTVNGQTVDRPATNVHDDAKIEIKAKPRFVSRGGEKLDAAFERFQISVANLICADVGASTGGFTDCLLQRGAARVYAIDVGHGVLDHRLRADPRVVVMEETNARFLEHLPEPIQFVSVDASFISLKLLLPVINGWLSSALRPPSSVVALIKPQFEAGRKDVGKGGVVKDAKVHRRVLTEVLTFAQEQGLNVKGLMPSPLRGPKGNVEFLTWLGVGAGKVDVTEMIDAALGEAERL